MFLCVSLRVRNKQNKYPILFLTQGVSDKYPELMDIRCQTTQIAISFAQSENILVSICGIKSNIYHSVSTVFSRFCGTSMKAFNEKLGFTLQAQHIAQFNV